MLKITFLGTGTSQGVPVIACNCNVCKSPDIRDKRLRTSIFIESSQTSVVVDTGPDFRIQMLSNNIRKLSGVIITHEHNDHVAGLDDIRPFNFKQKMNIPLFASQKVIDILRDRFAYAFHANPYLGAPRINTQIINPDKDFRISDLIFTPIQVYHANLPVIGLRIGKLCYITDANYIPESEYHKIKGAEILILNALHKKKHPSHFSLSEAIEIVNKFNISQAYFTHISHEMGKMEDIISDLPNHISFAYDGLSITLE